MFILVNSPQPKSIIMKKFYFLLFSIFVVSAISAQQLRNEVTSTHVQPHKQLSDGGNPWAYKFSGFDSEIYFENMPAVDAQTLLTEDEHLYNQNIKVLRFGYDHYVSLNLNNSGTWHNTENGDQVWRVGISSPGAISMNLSFKNMNLPEGCRLFVYNENKTEHHGAFTQTHVTADDKMLGTELLYGDKVIVELYIPQNALADVSMEIWRVTHAYKDMRETFLRAFGGSGACENNARCPAYASRDNQIRSGICLVDGGEFCSAALVNNTCNDGTPYVLTANHCGSSGFGSWIFRFNWEATGCTNPGSSPSSNSISGSVQRASSAGSDFNLLQMNSTPPSGYNVYYAGWDRNNTAPTNPFGVHHPSGDIKKFSQSTGTGLSATYGGAACWQTPTWTDGVTEPGSSGSPLFNNVGLIIGQLYGGPSDCSCENNAGCGYDYYGKLFTSWTGGGTNSTRLSNWLDGTCSTGATTLVGYDPNAPTIALDAGIESITTPANGITTCQTTFTPVVVLRNYGTTTLTSCTINYQVDGGGPATYNWTGSLATNATASITLPNFTVAASAHTYTSYTSSPNGGADGNTTNDSKTNSFTVINAPAGASLPFTEGFQTVTFPPAGWLLTNPDANNTWSRVTTAGGFGNSTASARMDNYSGTTDITGQMDYLTTPALSFASAVAPLYMDFSVAHARYNATYIDSLYVAVSTDCGATWTRVYGKGGTGLATAPDNTNAFVPTATQWRAEQINLDTYIGQASVLVRFESRSGWGNHLYVDDINLYFPNVPPVADFSATPTTVCAGSCVTFTDLTTGGPTSWSWSFTGGTPATSTSQNPAVCYNTPGIYSVTLIATNAYGSDTELKTNYITVNALPTASAGSNSPVCSGNTINLTANTIAGATYAWTGPGGFTSSLEDPTRPSATTAMAGVYTVTITVNGCSAVSSTTVVVNATPTATAGSNSPVCTGNTINLTGNTVAGATYSWTGPGGFTSTLEDPTRPGATTAMAGVYTLTITANGCTSAASNTTVVVNTTPTATAGSNSPVCSGNTLNLTGNTVAGATYVWSGPNGFTSTLEDPSITNVTTAASGAYTLTITSNGCTSAPNTTSVTINATPTATAGSNTPVCVGDNLNLTANTVAGATYSWTGPNGFTSTLEDPSITGAGTINSGNYTVTITNNGCVSSPSTTNVVVTTAADPTITPLTSSLCNNSSPYTMTAATAGGAWTATCGVCINATTGAFDPMIATVGTHTVTYTISGSCGGTDTETVTVIAAPSATASTNSPVCVGGQIDLTANTVAGATYAWTGPNGFSASVEDPSITNATAAMAGTYSLTITANGCSGVSGTSVVVNTAPIGTSTVNDVSCFGVCDGSMFVSVTGGASPFTVLWCDGNTSVITSAGSVNGLCPGACSVSITDANGCSTTVSNTVNEPAVLVLSETHVNETAPGNNGSIDLTITGGTSPYTISWSNSSTSEDLSGLAGGTYVATVTDANGCTQVITVVITSSVSIVELTANDFGIFPNPNNGTFMVQLPTMMINGDFNIYTPQGKLVYTHSIQNEKAILFNLPVASGIYFAELNAEGIKVVKKLIIE